MYLENNHCISIGRFSKQFCDNIITTAEKNSLALAEIDYKVNNKKNRSSKVFFLKYNKLNYTLRTVIN